MRTAKLLALVAGLTMGVAGLSRGAIVINEIDSDTANTPTTDFAEFIELYSTTGTVTDLSGLVLVLFNGNGNVVYRQLDLDGISTDANGYYVFGTNSVPTANNTTFLGAGNILQNGDDAVALLVGDATSWPNGTNVSNVNLANLVDAIVYDTGDPDNATLLAALGQTTEYDEFSGVIGGSVGGAADSLARFPNATGAFIATTPTPGAPNVGVPEPASMGLIGLAGVALAARRRGR